MKFIIKICDDLGFELSRHEVTAGPHYSPADDMVYFEFPKFYFSTHKAFHDVKIKRQNNDKKL